MAGAAPTWTGTPMEIDYLADHMHWAPLLARWHHREWGGLLPDWTAEHALAELQSHSGRTGIPTTLIACDGDELLGSVSLVPEDAPGLADATPWLASLYVAPVHRGRGIGSALVRRAVAEAARLGVARLHLYTPHHEDFYRALGWQPMARLHLGGCAVSVLWIAPTADQRRG
jgi:predicted N-acetyltransferase YhbS